MYVVVDFIINKSIDVNFVICNFRIVEFFASHMTEYVS